MAEAILDPFRIFASVKVPIAISIVLIKTDKHTVVICCLISVYKITIILVNFLKGGIGIEMNRVSCLIHPLLKSSKGNNGISVAYITDTLDHCAIIPYNAHCVLINRTRKYRFGKSNLDSLLKGYIPCPCPRIDRGHLRTGVIEHYISNVFVTKHCECSFCHANARRVLKGDFHLPCRHSGERESTINTAHLVQGYEWCEWIIV